MASIADAYVELHVDGDSLDGEVRSSVRGVAPGAEKESDKVGRSSGSRMAGAFLAGFASKVKAGGSKVGTEIKKAFKGFNPRGLMIPALAAAIPLLTSSLSAVTGALVAFTGAVVQAGASSLAAVGIFGTLIQTKLALKVATGGLTEALKGEEGAMKALAPPAQELVRSLKGLNPEWTKLKKAVQGTTFSGVGGSIERLAKAGLPTLQRGLVGTGRELNTIFKDVTKFAASEGFVRRFGNALQGNNAILRQLGKAATPVLDGILRLFRALQPSGLRLAKIIASAGKSFQAWASAPGFAKRIDDMMKQAFKSAGNLWGIIKNLGAVLRNVFGAATPAGAGLLKTLNDLTKRLADFTALASTKNAIAEWAQQGITVTGQLFSVLGRIGGALAPLFDPAIAGGFLSVFEKIMPVISSVLGVIQGALKPVLDGIGQAFAENGPKIAGLFTAMAPLLKGVGMVLGELIKQVMSTLGTVAQFLTPIVAAISNFVGPILQRFAPIIAGVIFAFTNWASVLIKFIPIVGRFLAPLAKLAEWIWGLVGPAFKFLGRIAGPAIKGIMKGFQILGNFLKGPFKAYWNGLVLTVKLAFAVIKRIAGPAWRVIKTIFSTAIRVIATVVRVGFNIVKTVIVTVFRVVRTIIVGAWRVISAVVRGAVRVIGTVIRTGFNIVKSVVTTVWNTIKNLTSNAWAKVSSLVSGGIDKVVGFIKSMPGKILNLASDFLNAGKELGGKVIDGIQNGLSAVGGFVSDIGSAIKNAINSALGLPITIKGPGPLPDFTIPAFYKGTRSAPGGAALVGERGPEIVNLPRGSRVHTNAESRKMAAASFPRKMILRIGSRDFVAYVESIADDRIDAADSLNFQGV
jgi:phage-related protein